MKFVTRWGDEKYDAHSMSRFKTLNLCCLDIWMVIGRTMLKQMGWSTFVQIAASQISVRNLRKPQMDINKSSPTICRKFQEEMESLETARVLGILMSLIPQPGSLYPRSFCARKYLSFLPPKWDLYCRIGVFSNYFNEAVL